MDTNEKKYDPSFGAWEQVAHTGTIKNDNGYFRFVIISNKTKKEGSNQPDKFMFMESVEKPVALFKKTSESGNTYYGGNTDTHWITVVRNQHKKEEKHPDINVILKERQSTAEGAIRAAKEIQAKKQEPKSTNDFINSAKDREKLLSELGDVPF